MRDPTSLSSLGRVASQQKPEIRALGQKKKRWPKKGGWGGGVWGFWVGGGGGGGRGGVFWFLGGGVVLGGVLWCGGGVLLVVGGGCLWGVLGFWVFFVFLFAFVWVYLGFLLFFRWGGSLFLVWCSSGFLGVFDVFGFCFVGFVVGLFLVVLLFFFVCVFFFSLFEGVCVGVVCGVLFFGGFGVFGIFFFLGGVLVCFCCVFYFDCLVFFCCGWCGVFFLLCFGLGCLGFLVFFWGCLGVLFFFFFFFLGFFCWLLLFFPPPTNPTPPPPPKPPPPPPPPPPQPPPPRWGRVLETFPLPGPCLPLSGKSPGARRRWDDHPMGPRKSDFCGRVVIKKKLGSIVKGRRGGFRERKNLPVFKSLTEGIFGPPPTGKEEQYEAKVLQNGEAAHRAGSEGKGND